MVASLANGVTTFTELKAITVPKDRKYKVVEVRPLTNTSCEVKINIETEEYFHITHDLHNDDKRPIVVDWDMVAGVKLSVTGINGDSSAHTIGFLVVYEDVAG